MGTIVYVGGTPESIASGGGFCGPLTVHGVGSGPGVALGSRDGSKVLRGVGRTACRKGDWALATAACSRGGLGGGVLSVRAISAAGSAGGAIAGWAIDTGWDLGSCRSTQAVLRTRIAAPPANAIFTPAANGTELELRPAALAKAILPKLARNASGAM